MPVSDGRKVPVATAQHIGSVIASVIGAYHPLVWVVAESAEDGSALLARIAKQHKTDVVMLGRLAENLAPLTAAKRRRAVDGLLEQLAGTGGDVPAFIDHSEVLFEPSLAIRVGAQMERLSRMCRALVVVWPGKVGGRELLYAAPGHPEHHAHPIGNARLVRVDAELSILAD